MSVVFGGNEATRAHAQSAAVKDSALDLFTVPPTNVTYNGYRLVEINPTSESITPIEFVIPGSREYIDFSRSYFRMDLILKKTDGGNVVAASQRWLAPNAFHTIIKQPSIYVNGTLTNEQTDTNAYKAYLETILNYGTEDEETILKPQGYYSALNHPGNDLTANQIDITHNDYKSLTVKRKKAVDGLLEMKDKTIDGKTIQLFGMPHADLFNTGRLLIPGVDLKMRFTLNDPKFFMNGLTAVATDIRLQAGDLKMKFYACMVKVRSDIYNEIAVARLKNNREVFYPTVRSEVRTYTLQNDHTTFTATDVFSGRVPDRVVVGLVYQEAFSGNYAYNPFNFPKFEVTSIKQIVEGEEYPYQALELNEDNGQLDMAGYHRLISANCSAFRGRCMIKPEHWGDDHHTTLYMWDNVASGCADSVQLNPKQEGRVKISLTKGAVNSLVTVILYGEFENMMQIKPTGSTQYDIYSQTLAGRNRG